MLMAATKKKKPIKTGTSSGHITHLKQSILETFNIYEYMPFISLSLIDVYVPTTVKVAVLTLGDATQVGVALFVLHLSRKRRKVYPLSLWWGFLQFFFQKKNVKEHVLFQ
jgi:hypothetical protein